MPSGSVAANPIAAATMDTDTDPITISSGAKVGVCESAI